MEIYKDPAFDMATEQFRIVADHLNISDNLRQRLLMPKRAVMVTLPVHRDDGSTFIFEGHRVQHHLTLGPTKGGTRYHPSVPGRSRRARHVDELEMRPRRPPLRRRQGRRHHRSRRALHRANSNRLPPLHAGDDPLHRLRTDIMGPTWAPTSRSWPGSWTPTRPPGPCRPGDRHRQARQHRRLLGRRRPPAAASPT
jgi:hypothetical protein